MRSAGRPVERVADPGRLARKATDGKKSLWQRVVDLALTDVRVAVGGMDHESLEDLEERLLAADFGVDATMRLIDHVEGLARRGAIRGREGLGKALREETGRILESDDGKSALREASEGPTVYLVVGVNGVGKTTSIGKLAHRLTSAGRRVLIAAADTYRAGAVSQLRVWAERTGADFVGGQQGGDPAAVAFDAIEAATARGSDVLIIDTAGRLHTQAGLMSELEKVERVIARKRDGAPHETLMVLDATVGQNALSQVRSFQQAVDVSGILLAKMDSTARGGIIVALKQEFGLTVKLVGVGERPEDLEPFDPDAFLEGVFTPTE